MVCYNRLNVNCPPYFEKLLRINSEHHQRNTRYSNYLIRKPNIKRAKEGGPCRARGYMTTRVARVTMLYAPVTMETKC